VQALVDYVARQPEALLDAPGDPRVGMAGASYGGAIQLVTAATEPRLDAIVPDLAWHSLLTTFARDGAVKSGWLAQLCANGEAFGLLDGIADGLGGPPAAAPCTASAPAIVSERAGCEAQVYAAARCARGARRRLTTRSSGRSTSS